MSDDGPGMKGLISRLRLNLPHMRGEGGAGEQPGPGGTRRSRRLQGRATPEEERTAWRRRVAEAGGPEAWRDWGGLPEDVLVKVAQTFVAQTEAEWAAQLEADGFREWNKIMDWRKREGPSLFVFAMVCKGWRKAQLKVGAPLRTRVASDVILPGGLALVKWALAEGCPREGYVGIRQDNMATAAAQYGHMELVRWLIQEQGFAMTEVVMGMAARSGNLELVRWLRGEGCDWSAWTCMFAAESEWLGVLQWLRANGCWWDAET